MSIIKVLPEELVNKIAAGEVVEKPASVVKELLDNAYDARPSHITVEVEDGGKTKIVVSDNGTGMDKEDALLAFKSHATSKLASEEDLFNINKFGFRGEALASISAVSKATLKTRRNNENMGTLIKVEGGNLTENSETGTAIGTTIIIEDLFFNTPARKEFLKQTQSEYRSILDVIDAHAIANPQVGLTFINEGKVVYTFPKDDEIEDRIRGVVGKDVFQNLMSVFYEHPHMEIFGYIGKPEIATERPKNQFIFVNKRKINDKAIYAVIKNTYSTLLPKTLQPQYVLMIQVQPNIVDVNVHPRKEEVKFSNPSLIAEGVKEAVKKAIERNNLTPGSANPVQDNQPKDPFAASPFGTPPRNMPMPGQRPLSPFSSPKSPFSGGGVGAPRPNPFAMRKPGDPISPFGRPNPLASPFPPPPAPFPANPGPVPASTKQPFGLFSDKSWDDIDDDLTEDDLADQKQKPQLKTAKRNFYVVKNLYIVKETENGLMIYDQHAVHERINYEKLLAIYEKGKNDGNTQKLLDPLIIELSAKDHSLLLENLSELEKTGFEIENFGNNTFKVNEVPNIFKDLDIKKLINEFVQDFEEDNKIKDVDSASHKALTYLACRSSYKANDNISDEEIEILLDKLETSDIKYTCPHGRPVKVELTLAELDKMFKRTGF